MFSIVIVTGSPLCHNPRVLKEASALAAVGFRVEVLGAWLSAEFKARDQTLLAGLPFSFTPVLDVTTQPWAWLTTRLQVKAAKFWHQHTGRESRWQLGYTVNALACVARARSAQTDLFIAHSEPALWAISQLSTLNSQPKFGVDMEDWFSEDLPAETRRYRPIKLLKKLEKNALCQGSYATCTSQAMSRALVAEYGCPLPKVIYNAFPWADRQALDGQIKDRRDRSLPSVHWYSQTLGTDRGLGDLFTALPLLKTEFEIHLRGKPVAGFDRWMAEQVPERWRKRIFLHPLVSNGELLSRIAEHDLGFAGELRYCKNKEFTVSNKILHYLLGGLAVVASNTTGQQEIAARADGAVWIYESGNAASLAAQLNLLLANPAQLQQAKVAALTVAEKEFCWERQIPIFSASVPNSIAADRKFA